MKLKRHVTRFQKELRKEIRLAIAAAIGFLIAFAWNDYIFNFAKDMFGSLSSAMPHISSFLTALILTVIGVIFLFISSKLLD